MPITYRFREHPRWRRICALQLEPRPDVEQLDAMRYSHELSKMDEALRAAQAQLPPGKDFSRQLAAAFARMQSTPTFKLPVPPSIPLPELPTLPIPQVSSRGFAVFFAAIALVSALAVTAHFFW